MKTIISALFALSVLAGIAGVAPTSARPNQWQATRIIIHLNDRTSITARRTSLEAKSNGWTWRGEVAETGEPVMMMWWKEGEFAACSPTAGTCTR